MRLAELTEKYELMTRAAESGAEDGASNDPPTGATQYTKTELQIINIAQTELDTFGEEQKRAIDKEVARISKDVASVPFVVSRSESEFRIVAEGIITETGRRLRSLYENKLEADKDYRLFKNTHGLKREASPAKSNFTTVAGIATALIIDSGLNALFLKDVNEFGLAGGFFAAAMIAFCNVALGFLVGWGPTRYFAHRYKLHLLWAIPIFIILILAIGVFNWGVANYRDLLIANRPPDSTLVLKTMRENPLAILNFQSYMMAIIGIIIAIITATQAYTAFDAYPWYGWVFRRKKLAETELAEEIDKIKGAIQEESEKFLAKATETHAKDSARAHQLVADYDSIVSSMEAYGATAQIIEDACNAVLGVYRENNIKVRDVARSRQPAYFASRTKLRRRADLDDPQAIKVQRVELAQRIEKLRASQEELERRIPEIKQDLLSEKSMRERLKSLKDEANADYDEEQMRLRRERKDDEKDGD